MDVTQELIAQAAGGNKAAFEGIYNATSGFVYRVALRITNNSADAEEVVQEVFMRIYRNLGKFRFQSSFKTWAYRITVNTAINRYRSSSREAERRQEYEAEALREERPNARDALAEKESAQKQVDLLLQDLSPEHRECILLREAEGLSYQEISTALKININTVRSRLKRAREALMEGRGEGGEAR